MKTINYFYYENELTNEDIIRYAKIIAQASKEISEIEEAKKRLRDLKETIELHSKYIQEGKIVSLYQGEFDWHSPVQDCVTVSSPSGRFPTFVRDMTPEEIVEHSQLEIPFAETVDQVTDMIVEVAQDAGFDTMMKDKKTNSEDEDSSTVDDDTMAVMLDQVDNDEYYDPGTFVPEEEDDKINSEDDDDIFLDNAGEEEYTKKGDYYIKGPQGFHSPMVWDVLRHDGHGRMPDHIGTFYSHSDAKRKVRELRKEAEIEKKEPKENSLLKEIEASMQIREWISRLQIYENMERRGEYFTVIDDKKHEVKINPKNSDDVWKYYIVAGYEKYETKRRNDEIVLAFLNKRKNWIPATSTEQQKQIREQESLEKTTEIMEKSEKGKTDQIECEAESIEVKDGTFFSVAKSDNRFFPWVIRKEVWTEGKLIESLGIEWADTEKEANAKLELKERELVNAVEKD